MKENLFVQQGPRFGRKGRRYRRVFARCFAQRLIDLRGCSTDGFAFALVIERARRRAALSMSSLQLSVGKRNRTGRTFDLARVDSFMPTEIRRLSVSFGTDLESNTLFSLCARASFLSTHFARVRLDGLVDMHVLFQSTRNDTQLDRLASGMAPYLCVAKDFRHSVH